MKSRPPPLILSTVCTPQPKESPTHRELLTRVLNDGMAIQTIDDEDRTSKICQSAVETEGMAVQFLRGPKQRSPRVLLAAVSQNPWALGKLYFLECTPEIYRTAVQKDGNTIQLFITRYYDEQIILLAIRQAPLSIRFIPNIYRSAIVCFTAISKDSKVIDLLTPEELIRASRYRP